MPKGQSTKEFKPSFVMFLEEHEFRENADRWVECSKCSTIVCSRKTCKPTRAVTMVRRFVKNHNCTDQDDGATEYIKLQRKFNALRVEMDAKEKQHRSALTVMRRQLEAAKKVAERVSVRYPQPKFDLNEIDIAAIPGLWRAGQDYGNVFRNLPNLYLKYLLEKGLLVRVGKEMWRYYHGGRWASSVTTKTLCEFLQKRLKAYCSKCVNMNQLYDPHLPEDVFEMFKIARFKPGYKTQINNSHQIAHKEQLKRSLLARCVDSPAIQAKLDALSTEIRQLVDEDGADIILHDPEEYDALQTWRLKMHEALACRLNNKTFRFGSSTMMGLPLNPKSPVTVRNGMKALVNGKIVRGPARVEIWKKGYKYDATPVTLTADQIFRRIGY
jgi:hypothetical protein